ncbi:hypothetical protein N431DRAFT_380881 [Stipitochalara longipes BDJ]|nr:hypothetical protein N431DRAFT_380881 [Stipitochalara longipes BDJ]
MEISIRDNAEPPELVIQTLIQHLPYSLPTLRRIQFMETKTGGCKTPDSHVLSTFDAENPGKDFLIAFLDFSWGPNTEMWLYSSLVNPECPGDEAVCEQQVLKLLIRVGEIEKAYGAQRATPGILLIGSLDKKIFQLLQKHSLVKTQTPEHLKYLFRVKDLPSRRELPHELLWSSIRPSDIPLVLSRTSIPYEERLMMLNPSASIETDTGVPIAWAFLGPDGSLKVLHCEEEYRGQGFGKAVALKLFHDRAVDLVQDGLYHADVAVENLPSQGVCKGLNGTVEGSGYWSWVYLS